MPDKCSAPGCFSNYDNKKEYVSVFRFPKDPERRQLWLRKIPRKDFTPGNRTFICAKHFEEDDIIRFDEIPDKNGALVKLPRIYPKLRDGAYPHIFQGCPNYLTENKVSHRSSRDEKLKAAEEKLFSNFLAMDHISSFEVLSNSLAEKVKKIDDNAITQANDAGIFILFVNYSDVPLIRNSIKIASDLSLTAFAGNSVLPQSCISHLLTDENKLALWSQLENIIQIVKDYNINSMEIDYHKKAIELWDNFILPSNETIYKYDCKHFLREQMYLCNRPKMAKRYSNDLLTFSFSLYIKSPTMYKLLCQSDMLSLPSADHLKRLIPFKLNQSLISESNRTYIRAKCNKLEETEKLINLLIDEIHVKPDITYKGKYLTGFAENAPFSTATSIQSYMISSIFSKYKEIVALIPVSKMTAEDLFNYTCQVLELLEHAGFNVLCILSDNNRINRNMFEHLSKSKTFNYAIKNPANTSKSLFLLFDTVHLIKSVRNNWINQNNVEKTFQYPDFDDTQTVRKAHFSLLRKVYHTEKDSLVKYAPKLCYKAMYPKVIERQNVGLALKVFDETNVIALELYGKQNLSFPNWKDTAIFLRLLIRWWDIMNISHLKKGQFTRNENSMPFMSADDERLLFLENFANWLKTWSDLNQNKRSGCLTNETSFALQHTSSTLPLVIKHLLQNEAKFVLTSKFQTDQLESRFGQYRQMSGANYHVCVQQVLESERKLRVQSVLQLHSSTHGNIPIKTLLSSMSGVNTDNVDIDHFIDNLGEIDLDVLTIVETDIIIYIAGYCSFKLNLTCALCIMNFFSSETLFIDSNEASLISTDIENYLSMINRGGLRFPSHFVIEILSYCYLIFQKLIADNCENIFLKSNAKQHSIYVKLSETYLLNQNIITTGKCDECGKEILDKVKKIISIFGNVCLNNYSKVIKDKQSSDIHERKLKKFKK